MKVTELSAEQRNELKGNYLTQVMNDGLPTSWDDLLRADEIVSDKVLNDYYEGIDFVDDDFFCTASI